METIKDIALRIQPNHWHYAGTGIERFDYVGFAEALIAEIAKQNEPVALIDGNDEAVYFQSDVMYHYWIGRNCTPLYTFPPTAEQIANETAEAWQPIETAPKDGQSYLAYSTEFVNQYWVTDKCNGMTHWMPLPKAPANGASS